MIFDGEYINDFTKAMEPYLKDGWFDNTFFRPYLLKEIGNNNVIAFRVPGYTVGEIEIKDGVIVAITTFARACNVFKVDYHTLEDILKKQFIGKKFDWGELWLELIKDYDDDKK